MGKTIKSAAIRIKDAVTTNRQTVRAVVTAPTLDRDYEVIDTRSLRLPLKGGGWIYASELTGKEALDIPFLLNHSMVVEDVIGSVSSGVINDAGELEVEFAISSLPKAQDMLTLLDEGHLGNAFSITINDYTYDSDGTYRDGEVIEISLVFKGSNRNARLLEVSKSLLKGDRMAEATKSPELTAKYEELQALTKEIEAAEAKAKEAEPTEVKAEAKVEVPAEGEPAPKAEEKPAEQPKAEVKVEETPKPAEQPAPAAPEAPTTTPKENTNMTETESKAISAKAAAAKPKELEQPVVKAIVNPDEHKLITAKQINAWNAKNYEALRELNAIAKKIDEANGVASKAIKSKEISYSDANPLYLAEQVNRDVELCRGEYGLAPLVTKINLTESPKFRTLTQDGDIDFVPVGWAGTKPEDETGFGSVSVEPKPFAVIQVWNDHAADDALVNLYNIMVQNVADAEARLDDRLIATFETVTADSVVYPTQGIVPRLAGGRIVEHDGSGEDFFAKFLQAMGMIRNCDANNVTVAFNRNYIYTLAGLRNQNGDLIFTGTGNTLNMGMVGNVRFVTTDILDAGDVLLGNFRRGYLANKGGLELTTSNQAIVGSRNLFTTDHTALRAVVRKEFDVSDGSLAGAFALVRPAA